MTVAEVMKELEQLGTEQTKKTWTKHGATGNFWGVKIGDMKLIQKKIKHNHELALALYKTDNVDAMYFAGLISEPQKMTKADLQYWADKATWYMLGEYMVAWVTSEGNYGHEMAMKWISSGIPHIASIGWSTYGCLLALKKDEELDIKEIKGLLATIQKSIHQQSERVGYTMNNFVIAVGAYVSSLTEQAKKVAAAYGEVKVNMGDTACKVPDAVAYIEKIEGMGKIGKKKKTVFC